MTIEFTKMHGLGNDFIVIDNFNGRIKLSPETIALLCDRHKGIGADGLILVENRDSSDAFMNYYNADGTEAEMCGNGVRCTAYFLKNYYLKDKNLFNIDTRAGQKEVKWEGGKVFSVNMGKPVFNHKDFPNEKIKLEGLELDFVSMGNPHAISFVENIDLYNLKDVGPKIEVNSNFPNKINFELVQKLNDREYKVKVWERGCGETMACGTGACAVYALAQKDNNSKKEITISLPGGKLFISENKEGEIIMKGEVASVFSGLIDITQ